MLILILTDVQYSRKAVFSFEKGSNCQNHSSGFIHLVKKSPPLKFLIPSPPLIWKTQVVTILYDNIKFLENIKQGFKRTIFLNKQAKIGLYN